MSNVASRGRAGLRGAVLRGLLLLAALLTWAGGAHAETAQQAGVRSAPRPNWVSALDLAGAEPAAANGGVSVLALQFEARFVGGKRERYHRRVVRVVSEAGVRLAGEQRFAFVPPYQRLVLHGVRIRRAGQIVSALNLQQLRILQRETRLDAGVYSGERTAVALLDDVRVGDELDCEYSIVGQNPVLAGHVMSRWQLGFANAVGLLRYRVLSDRELTSVAFGGAPAPEIASVGALRQYGFTATRVPGYPAEEGIPAEHDPFPWLQLTDFESWSQVAAWGTQLFQRPPPSASLLGVARKACERELSDEMRVTALLRFVQERIRYTSLAFAEGSHRPTDPELVLKRGFGDCKDKSLLLVKLLEAIGVHAWPALVSSTGGERVETLMPTLDAFDHVIVALELAGKRYFVDPTRQHQRGTLENVSNQPFGRALVLDGGDGKLVDVPHGGDSRAELYARLRYDVSSFDSPVNLVSKVTYRGTRAEGLRALLAVASEDDYNKALQSVVRASHPDAEPQGTPFVRDNEVSNEIEVEQQYRLPSPWVKGPGGRHRLPLFPPWLRAEMVPPVAGRVNPLLVPFPRHIVHDIVVRLPHAWPRHDADEKYSVGPYYIAYLEQVHDNTASIHFDFQTVRRRLEPAELASYREALEHADRVLAISIGEMEVLTPAWNASVVWLLSALWTIIVLSAIALVQHYEPYLKRPRVTRDPRLARRGGWLWLIAMGVTFSPYNQLKSLITMATLFDEPTWSQLTSRGSVVYRAWFAPVATLQFLACIFALLWGCYCVYLFWANRRSFPLAFVVALALTSAVTIVDHLLSAGLRSDEAPSRDLETFLVILSSVIAAIWIGYCLTSRRVASLFVPIDEGDDEGEPSEPLSHRLAADPEGP